jgi:pyruvate kinase
MRTTKIVVTIGPASNSQEVLGRLFSAGVDVVRFNMSHGSHRDHDSGLAAVEAVTSDRGLHVARMADLCGPKIRTGEMAGGECAIAVGAVCVIARDVDMGTSACFGTNCPSFVDDVEVGHRVLIDDGLIRLRVTEKRADDLVCECESGGSIGSRKGINVPDSNLSVPSLTEKDHSDLRWAVDRGFDFVALSFVRCVGDVEDLRAAICDAGGDVPIVSKIETPQAIDSLDAIIKASDAVLVARGDLGVEMDVSLIPLLQKDIVRRCRSMGKPVIVATQMLHSMVSQSSPTRAEVSDVANAVLDGSDAVMLSAESAVGRYPVQSVAMMNRICAGADAYRPDDGCRPVDLLDGRLHVGHAADRTRSAVARSAAIVTRDLGAKLVAVWCQSGLTAQWMSKYRMNCPLVGMSHNAAVCRRLAMSGGVEPMLVLEPQTSGAAPWADVEDRLTRAYDLKAGDTMVVVGDPTARDRASTLGIYVVEPGG